MKDDQPDENSEQPTGSQHLIVDTRHASDAISSYIGRILRDLQNICSLVCPVFNLPSPQQGRRYEDTKYHRIVRTKVWSRRCVRACVCVRAYDEPGQPVFTIFLPIGSVLPLNGASSRSLPASGRFATGRPLGPLVAHRPDMSRVL